MPRVPVSLQERKDPQATITQPSQNSPSCAKPGRATITGHRAHVAPLSLQDFLFLYHFPAFPRAFLVRTRLCCRVCVRCSLLLLQEMLTRTWWPCRSRPGITHGVRLEEGGGRPHSLLCLQLFVSHPLIYFFSPPLFLLLPMFSVLAPGAASCSLLHRGWRLWLQPCGV